MTDDADLLAELATVDEVEAYLPTNADHVAQAVPAWCELVLSVKRFDDGTLKPSHPLNVRMPLRRHDGELIIEVLQGALHPDANKFAVEAMWAALDDVVDRLQRRVNKGKEPLKSDRGEALGLATAIALLSNPIEPDVDEVRSVAMERWEIRHP